MTAKYNILKALDFDKTCAKFKAKHRNVDNLYTAGWMLQMKYDGVFGKAVIRENGDHEMLSRTGEPILSADHILEDLHIAVQSWPGDTPREVVVLGELWHPSLPFPTISGDVRRHRPSPHLFFVANDILTGTEMYSAQPYIERYMDLACVVLAANAMDSQVRLAVQRVLPDDMTVGSQANAWVALGGYDGAILRDPRGRYTVGDAGEGQIVKVKPLLMLSLRVVDLIEVFGIKTGRSVFTCTVEYRGVRTNVGSGMPHDRLALPAVGQIVEIAALSLTEDGKLREPRYKGIRHDVLRADE